MPKKQKSGLYRARIKIGVDPKGNDIYKYISGSTKTELDKRKKNVIEYYIEGTGLEADMMFGQYAHEWFTVRKAPYISASSKQSYRTALNKEILPVFGMRHLRSIRPIELQAFLNEYKGRSLTKITVLVSTLNGIFRSACADRILNRNPMEFIRKPAYAAPSEKRVLTQEERKTIEQICATHPRGAYLAAMYYLGVRPGEARGLQWQDFDWETNMVHIQRDIDYKDGCKAGSLKTKKSNRWIPVPDKLKSILRPLVGPSGDFCFPGEVSGGPLAKAVSERLWVDMMLSGGLVESVPKEHAARYANHDIRRKWKATINPHMLRHNYVTMCWENGFDVYTTMKLVGHTSIKTTMDIYNHLSDKQMEKVKVQLNGMFDQG